MVAKLLVLHVFVMPYITPSLPCTVLRHGFWPSPSVPGKLCKIVKSLPSGFSLNAVPPPFFAWCSVVPYSAPSLPCTKPVGPLPSPSSENLVGTPFKTPDIIP